MFDPTLSLRVIEIRDSLARFRKKIGILEERREEFLRDHSGEWVAVCGFENNIRFGESFDGLLAEIPMNERSEYCCQFLQRDNPSLILIHSPKAVALDGLLFFACFVEFLAPAINVNNVI